MEALLGSPCGWAVVNMLGNHPEKFGAKVVKFISVFTSGGDHVNDPKQYHMYFNLGKP